VLGPPGSQILLLDESYNANPASMQAALEGLAGTDYGGRRVAILGDMLELAPPDQPHISIRYHKGLFTALEQIDRVLCAGPMMKELYDMLPVGKQAGWARDSESLKQLAVNELQPEDAVMVKGSLGS